VRNLRVDEPNTISSHGVSALVGRSNLSAELARQVSADESTIPAWASEKLRRGAAAKVERWAEPHWWDTRPWRKRPGRPTK
jgi:hypothetical protein